MTARQRGLPGLTHAWLPAPDPLALGDAVDVWRMPLAPPAHRLAALAATLDAAEHARAARFHFARDRTAFIAVRGALRTLAGRYLARRPEELALGYHAHGKPYLAAPAHALRFNVSHSGDHALLAFSRAREVGVDVEHRRALRDLDALARTSFSPHEYAAFGAVPAAAQPAAFFTCWSRKEAFIKATGEGIAQLAAFDVSLDHPARLLRIAGLPADQTRWSIHELPAIADHAAALVVEGVDPIVRCWAWA